MFKYLSHLIHQIVSQKQAKEAGPLVPLSGKQQEKAQEQWNGLMVRRGVHWGSWPHVAAECEALLKKGLIPGAHSRVSKAQGDHIVFELTSETDDHSLDCLKLILKHHPHLASEPNENGHTPLMRAFYWQNKAAADILMNYCDASELIIPVAYTKDDETLQKDQKKEFSPVQKNLQKAVNEPELASIVFDDAEKRMINRSLSGDKTLVYKPVESHLMSRSANEEAGEPIIRSALIEAMQSYSPDCLELYLEKRGGIGASNIWAPYDILEVKKGLRGLIEAYKEHDHREQVAPGFATTLDQQGVGLLKETTPLKRATDMMDLVWKYIKLPEREAVLEECKEQWLEVLEPEPLLKQVFLVNFERHILNREVPKITLQNHESLASAEGDGVDIANQNASKPSGSAINVRRL